MADSSVAGLCRLTVRAPARSIDLAAPADVPVSDLLPTLLRYAGQETEESGLEHGGWVLQRLGGAPLDDEGTLASLDLRDGEVLYLRPHRDALPEVRMDDLVDGIANITRERLHGWSPEAGRRLLRGLAAATVITALVLLAWPGADPERRAAVAAVAGLLLLAGAASASRAAGDAGAAATLGVLTVPALALTGWLLPGGDLGGPQANHVLGARLLAAGAAGAGAAVLALAVAAVAVPMFLSAAVVALAAALAGTLMVAADVSADSAACVVAAAVVVLGGFVPMLAFWFAGLRMPPLPTGPHQLQEGIEPYEGREIEVRAELAGHWMTALYGAIGAICAGCLLPLAIRPSLPELLTALALSALLLLHGRGMVHVWQRLALVVPGAIGAVALCLAAGARTGGGDRQLLVALLLALAAALIIASWTVPGRRMVPYWGRAAEMIQYLLAAALLPLTLWLLGALAALRAING
ncbi:type VII secretion integral membrane protein EccD [Streptomyces polygonati]|uniref:Type VII secretion integral membrane protein EccD n=1 Tax=Streptomyces polygonati TaxID=1617087 RepID=A0ABV8HQV2_9ACTN